MTRTFWPRRHAAAAGRHLRCLSSRSIILNRLLPLASADTRALLPAAVGTGGFNHAPDAVDGGGEGVRLVHERGDRAQELLQCEV